MSQFSTSSLMLIGGMIIFYIIFTSWLTFRLRSKTNDQFMTAAKSVPAVVVGILMMSEFIGAKSTVGTAQEAFTSGLAASWSTIAAVIGFVLFSLFLVKKMYNSDSVTISGIIEKKYGKSTKIAVSLIMIYALLLVNVGNYISGAAALSSVFSVNLPMAYIVIAVVSTFYFAFGGMKSVAYVTILHTAMKYLGIIVILVFALSKTGGIAPMIQNMPDFYFTWDGKIGAATVIAWVVATTGSIFSTQFIIQAISSTKSAAEAKRSTIFAAILCLPIAIMLGLIGVAAKYAYPDIKSVYALPVFINSMNPVIAGFVTTSLVASIFVSVCTVALAISSLVVKDFYVPYFKPSAEREFKMTRIFSLIIGFVPLLFVFLFPSVLQLSFFTRAIRLSIAIIAVLGFYLPFFNSNRGATIGVIGAAVMTSVWYAMGNPYGIDNIYVAIATPVIVMIVERLFSGNKKIETKQQEQTVN
jgi:SSS family solute:Na+ symporter